MLNELKRDLKKKATEKRAKGSARFFKTGKGEYGEGDKFIGVTMPDSRKIARKYKDLPYADLAKLLRDEIHDYRTVALIISVERFKSEPEKVYRFYLKNMKYVNNWDLVDGSAPHIVGAYLEDKNRGILKQWADTGDLWKQRIAMIATYYFIQQGDFKDALVIARKLLSHNHDLIHKAVGWMLREIGNRDLATEETFLKKHHKKMPRTMLRYAIEKFPEKKRQAYLKGKM